jgi:hypothetical protein
MQIYEFDKWREIEMSKVGSVVGVKKNLARGGKVCAGCARDERCCHRLRDSPIGHGVHGKLRILPWIHWRFPAELVALEDFLSLIRCSIYQIRIHFGFLSAIFQLFSSNGSAILNREFNFTLKQNHTN